MVEIISTNLNAFAISGVLIFLTNLTLSLYVLVRGYRHKTNVIWSLETLAVALYGLGIFRVALTSNPDTALLWWRITHIGVILIPTIYYNFTHYFLGLRNKFALYTINILGLFFLIANATPHFINQLRYVFNQFYYDSPPTILYIAFVVFFIVVLFYSHILLWRVSHRKSSPLDETKKLQVKYFYTATFIGLTGGITAFFPVFGVDWYPYLNFTVAIYPIIMTYAIFKFRLFNTKAVVAEVLVFILWLFLIIRLLTDSTVQDRILDSLFLFLAIIIGIFLIRSVIAESHQREQQEKLALKLRDLAGNLQDIVAEQTKELRAGNDRLRELLSQKSEMLDLVAHQLRTPLTAIHWIAQSFTSGELGELNEKQAKYSRMLDASANNVISVVSDILDVIKIEGGKFGFVIETLDPNDVIQNVIDSCSLMAQNKHVKFSVDVEEDLPEIESDRERLRTAFENIVTNAIQYTKKGGRVDVNLSHRGNNLVLEVRDTGIGIPEGDKARIFTKLFRSENAVRSKTNGNGLGLYLAKNIIDALGGSIAFTSEVNVGTHFTITLPIKPKVS